MSVDENGVYHLMYGEILEANEDVNIELDDDTTCTIDKGSNAIVGFDDMLYHFNADVVQPIDTNEMFIDGVSSSGLSVFLAKYLDINMGIEEVLKAHNMSLDMLAEYIRHALIRLGAIDDMQETEPEEDD